MKNIYGLLVILLSFLSVEVFAKDLNKADLVGEIADIKIRYGEGGQGDILMLYFKNIEKDRWGCIESLGYVEITNLSSYVSDRRLEMIYSLALTAKATGKSFGTGGPSNCRMQNFGIMFDD